MPKILWPVPVLLVDQHSPIHLPAWPNPTSARPSIILLPPERPSRYPFNLTLTFLTVRPHERPPSLQHNRLLARASHGRLIALATDPVTLVTRTIHADCMQIFYRWYNNYTKMKSDCPLSYVWSANRLPVVLTNTYSSTCLTSCFNQYI